MPHDSGGHRSGVDADTELQPAAIELSLSHQLLQSQGECTQRGGVVGPRIGNTRRDHVAVTDGLDLLETELVDEFVEDGEHLVQQLHDLWRTQLPRQDSEPLDVGKEDRCLVELVRDR